MISNNYNAPSFSGIKKASAPKAFVAAAMTMFTGCFDGPFQRISQDEVNLSTKNIKVLDSLRQATKTKPADTALSEFAEDVIQVPNNLAKEPAKFMKKVLNEGEGSTPQQFLYYIPNIVSTGKTTTTILSPVYESKIISSSIKPIIKDGYYTNKSGKAFVPVEWVGKYKSRYASDK